VPYGVDDQLSSVVNIQRLHDVGAMHGDGVGAKTQDGRDLFVGFSVDD
jgi:hypothetical protein